MTDLATLSMRGNTPELSRILADEFIGPSREGVRSFARFTHKPAAPHQPRRCRFVRCGVAKEKHGRASISAVPLGFDPVQPGAQRLGLVLCDRRHDVLREAVRLWHIRRRDLDPGFQ